MRSLRSLLSCWWRAMAALAVGAVCFPALADDTHGDWPFQPPRRPPAPVTVNIAWAANPVDQFILAQLEAAGLRPAAAADKLTLLRRLSFDLLGLPPTADEQAAFAADDRPDAYERLVDRMLASPAFGEKTAQFWLDLVRYAETDGFKADDLRPNAHKYRDFVVRAFNADLPYDRFVAWQLAGDEFEPGNPLALVATGYNRLYPDEYNAANLQQRRQEILDDVTATTAVAFMGLTMGCAQCHDHKFDDIAQSDYFGLQAFFSPLVPRDDLPDASPDELAHHHRQLALWQEATSEVRAEIERLLAPKREQLREYGLGKFSAEIREAVALSAGERSPYQEQIARMALRQAEPKEADVAAKLSADDKPRYQELLAKLKEFDSLRPAPLPTLMAVSDVGRTAPPTRLLDGGAWQKPADEIAPGFPQLLGDESAEIASPASGIASTGRRSALARWLTRPEHPLTSRVVVNRLWQRHFGSGIVPTTNDFGAQGERPTHPELLDWLAVELVENGWSLKHVQRLMVTSATYRQTSRVDACTACGAGVSPAEHETEVTLEQQQAGRLHHNSERQAGRPHHNSEQQAGRPRHKADPQNRLLWHARRRRLEGEAIRDAMLAISGQLSRRMFGASARPELPAGLSKSYAWAADERPDDRDRRSVYVLAKRNLHYPLFEVFDQPDMHHSCPRRAETTTAPQSLLLLNGELALDQARYWARRLSAEHSDLRELVATAYREAFARAAEPAEIEAATAFITAQAKITTAPAGDEQAMPAAIADFCHALFNSNEFLYVD